MKISKTTSLQRLLYLVMMLIVLAAAPCHSRMTTGGTTSDAVGRKYRSRHLARKEKSPKGSKAGTASFSSSKSSKSTKSLKSSKASTCSTAGVSELIALATSTVVTDPVALTTLIDEAKETCYTGTAEEVTDACAAAGDGCCAGAFACSWIGEATVCPCSCDGEQACMDLPEGAVILPESCTGLDSCFQDATDDSSFFFVGHQSCDGTGACSGVDPSSVTVGNSACSGFAACASAYENSPSVLEISNGSCIGFQACNSFGFVAQGPGSVGTNSCIGSDACRILGLGSSDDDGGPTSISVGDNACRGVGACFALGLSITTGSIVVADGVCNTDTTSVESCDGDATIGSVTCLGDSTCTSFLFPTDTTSCEDACEI